MSVCVCVCLRHWRPQAGFKKLFSYIQGANADNTTVDFAVPITNVILPGAGPFCVDNFVRDTQSLPRLRPQCEH